jgi:hypothetical protein
MNCLRWYMAKKDNDMFENGDPWDLIVNVTATLERLILAHNNLNDDVRKIVKKQAVLDARMQEIRRLIIDEHFMDNIKRTK